MGAITTYTVTLFNNGPDAATGIEVEPLLQATDPSRFHPDPGVADDARDSTST